MTEAERALLRIVAASCITLCEAVRRYEITATPQVQNMCFQMEQTIQQLLTEFKMEGAPGSQSPYTGLHLGPRWQG